MTPQERKLARAVLDQAEKYRQIGLNVIPIKYGHKTPIAKWEEFQHRRLTQTEFDSAFRNGQLVNIGIVCGRTSRNFVCLDFDSIDGFHKFFPNPRLQNETPITQSSRGRHVWIRTERPVKSFSVPQLSLDVLGEGKLAIAPPSRHPDGTIYSFLNPKIIEPMPVNDFQNAILERCQALHLRVPNTLAEPGSDGLDGKVASVAGRKSRRLTQADKDTILRATTPIWIRGHRHQICIYLLGAFVKAGVSQSTAIELITRICDSTNDEEKPERLRQVAYHYKKPVSSLPKLKGLSGLKEALGA